MVGQSEAQSVRWLVSHTFETRDRIRKIECIKVKAEERAINGGTQLKPSKNQRFHCIIKYHRDLYYPFEGVYILWNFAFFLSE